MFFRCNLCHHTPKAEATKLYPKIMGNVFDSLCSKPISQTKQIEMIWIAVFYLQEWTLYLQFAKDLNLLDYFITINAYY